MISTLYKYIDEPSEKSLYRLNALAESEKFLAGLGFRCLDFKIDPAYPVVKDISKAYYLMVSQEMWDRPQPTDEKYFVGVVEDSVERYKHYDNEERKRRTSCYSNHIDGFGVYIRARIATAFKKNKILEYALDERVGKLPAKDIEGYVFGQITNEIDAYFLKMILGSYLGGLERWPVTNHLLECFETGGIPCGWIGPNFEDGGVPKECMQVLHFG